jgi:hypothetical protein
LAFSTPNKIPFLEGIVVTPASENDLNVFKQEWGNISNRTFYGHKIYIDSKFFEDLALNFNSYMLTTVKAVKGQSEAIKQRNKAADDLFSKVRQPIKSLFNWLIVKTDIQRASKVRSTKGLLVHVFVKIAAAFIYLIF